MRPAGGVAYITGGIQPQGLAGHESRRLQIVPATDLIGRDVEAVGDQFQRVPGPDPVTERPAGPALARSEEHTSELQSRLHLVCRLLLEKKKKKYNKLNTHKWIRKDK